MDKNLPPKGHRWGVRGFPPADDECDARRPHAEPPPGRDRSGARGIVEGEAP